MARPLRCPSCNRGVFITNTIAVGVENGITIELDAVKHLRCIFDGTDWLYDASATGESFVVPLVSREGARLIGECRKKEWDDHMIHGVTPQRIAEESALLRPEGDLHGKA